MNCFFLHSKQFTSSDLTEHNTVYIVEGYYTVVHCDSEEVSLIAASYSCINIVHTTVDHISILSVEYHVQVVPKTCTRPTFCNNFGKCTPIVIVLSPADSLVSLQ